MSQAVQCWADPGPVIRLLGQVSIAGPDRVHVVSPRMDRLVLARLVLAESRSVAVDTLIAALWAGNPPAGARNALQVKISRLRSALGPARPLIYQQGTYRLPLDPEDSDIGRLRQLTEQARGLAAADPARAHWLTEQALNLWRGDPLVGLGDDPAAYAASLALRETWLDLRETHAQTYLDTDEASVAAISSFRAILDDDPHRPGARLGLMRALERRGRRAEALAVYDAGRRQSLGSGLEPPTELRAEFERLLADEQEAARTPPISAIHRRAPSGLLDSARWLADEGDLANGLQLAIRGAWWWWIGGKRSAGRELLEDLRQRSTDSANVNENAILSATGWIGVFGSNTEHAPNSLARASTALAEIDGSTWATTDALAAALIAERLYERGQHADAARLLTMATSRFTALGDEWGTAVCGTIAARGQLLAGDTDQARRQATLRRLEFIELGDAAGQVMTLDLIGYIAEVRGDLTAAQQAHHEALNLARSIGATDWEATELTRLGNVETLAEHPSSIDTLERALEISNDLGSHAVAALARNGLGFAWHLAGDDDAAANAHNAARRWYTATGSQAGLAYTDARLAMTASSGGESADALAVASLRAACDTNDPRAIAHSLEAIAMASRDLARSAKALTAAAELRHRALAPLPPIQLRQLQPLRRRLLGLRANNLNQKLLEARERPMSVARELTSG